MTFQSVIVFCLLTKNKHFMYLFINNGIKIEQRMVESKGPY